MTVLEPRGQLARPIELEQLKSEFLLLVSHELRGPVAVVRGYLDMVSGGTFGKLPTALETALPVLTGKMDELQRVVEQMLETLRVEAQPSPLALEQMDLRQVALECAYALAPNSLAGGQRIRFALSPHPVLVDGERTRVAALLSAVIENAIKFSPDGGEITLACRADLPAGIARVLITDHGLGVTPKDSVRLFTRFGRIVTPENSHLPGIGLGLHLARESARRHGGDIVLSSRGPGGTRVEITLPLSR